MFDGLLKKGHQLGIMLSREFPSMIYRSCIDRIGLDKYNYLLDEGSIFQENSNIYNDLIKYYGNFRYTRDSKVISSSTTDNKIEILVNTEDFLGRHITHDRQKKYEEGLLGTTDVSPKDRLEFIQDTSSLCKVTGNQNSNGNVVYIGSCCQYWKKTYCVHAAVFQYRTRLSSHAIIVPTTRNKSYRCQSRNLYTNILKDTRTEYLTVQTNLTDINNKLLKTYNDKDGCLMLVVASFPNIVRKMEALNSVPKWQLYSKRDMAHLVSTKMFDIKSQIN